MRYTLLEGGEAQWPIQADWAEPVSVLNVDGIVALLPIIVSRDNRSLGIDNCQSCIAKRLAYLQRNPAMGQGAHDDSRTSHVSNDKATDQYLVHVPTEPRALMFANLELNFGRESRKAQPRRSLASSFRN
jgi:hypothetical protein